MSRPFFVPEDIALIVVVALVLLWAGLLEFWPSIRWRLRRWMRRKKE